MSALDGVRRNLYLAARTQLSPSLHPAAGTRDSRNLCPNAGAQVGRRIESAATCIQPPKFGSAA